MRNSHSRGISSTVAIAAIVVLIIIAAAGWAAYAAFPLTKTGAGVTQTVTATQTITAGQTVTSTATGSAGTSNSTPYLAPISSTASFTVVGFTTTSIAADWFTGLQSGIFKQYIPGATFTSFPSGAQVPQALSSGQAQIGFVDPSVPIPAIAQGSPIKMVAMIVPHNYQWGVWVASNSTYKTVQSLHGGIFVASAVGSTPYYDTQYCLSKFLGWKLNQDYTISAVGAFPSEIAALETGAAQGLVAAITDAYPLAAAGQIRSIYNFTLPLGTNALFTTSSFIQQHPDAVKATIEAFLHAGDLYESNTTLAYNVLQSHFHLSLSGAEYTHGAFTYSSDGAISIGAEQQYENFIYSVGAVNQNISVSTFIYPGFVPVTY